METETKYNVYGNESSPKITYKYVDGYWQKQYKIYDYLGSLRYTISQMNKVLNYKAYDPYGNELIDTMNQTRQGYIGKENDIENGLGEHGVRKYDPSIGRFNSGDALWEKFPGISPYVYCFNNPIRLIDWNGFLPGDPFDSKAQAAHDFGKNYNPISIYCKKEIGASIYKIEVNGETKYTYSIPILMGKTGGNPSTPPGNEKVEAEVHTHGNYKQNAKNNEFSDYGPDVPAYYGGDINHYKDLNILGFVVTPNGSLKQYNPITGEITTVTIDMPSDPNDPTRQNNIEPINKETRPVLIKKEGTVVEVKK